MRTFRRELEGLRDLLFPDGKLNPLSQADDYEVIRQYEWVLRAVAFTEEAYRQAGHRRCVPREWPLPAAFPFA
jgi:hypothetical protein